MLSSRLIRGDQELHTDIDESVGERLVAFSNELRVYSSMIFYPLLISYLSLGAGLAFTYFRINTLWGVRLWLFSGIALQIIFLYYISTFTIQLYGIVKNTMRFEFDDHDGYIHLYNKDLVSEYKVREENAILFLKWFSSFSFITGWILTSWLIDPFAYIGALSENLVGVLPELDYSSLLGFADDFTPLDLKGMVNYLGEEGIIFILLIGPLGLSTYLFLASTRIILKKRIQRKSTTTPRNRPLRQELISFLAISYFETVKIVSQEQNLARKVAGNLAIAGILTTGCVFQLFLLLLPFN